MKTGIELIAQERKEQIEKHDIAIEDDAIVNNLSQLPIAAYRLIVAPESDKFHDLYFQSDKPINWNLEVWTNMNRKTYKERLVIAGALIAAEIDRLNTIS